MPLQATSGAASYDAFGGGVVAEPNYIESCFSTYLYTGTGAAQTITNGIDLAGKGGLVWQKCRSNIVNHKLLTTYDLSLQLSTNTTSEASGTEFDGVSSTGFSVTSALSDSGRTYASWTFRKQPKFFDVVTYTGSGSSGQVVPHNLGSVPACVIVKRLDTAQNWTVYHKDIPNQETLRLNLTNASTGLGGTLLAASTNIQVYGTGTDPLAASGGQYVAYLFASNAGGFGLTGTDNVISCGSFTTDSGGSASITLGYEPQWMLVKAASTTSNWEIYDNMRGWRVGGDDVGLFANTSGAENPNIDAGSLTATGVLNFTGLTGALDATYIYIAIRRGPMKVPTSGTSVFTPDLYTGNGTTQSVTSGSPPLDLVWIKGRTGSENPRVYDRLRGATKSLAPDTTAAETTRADGLTAFTQTGFNVGSFGNENSSGTSIIAWDFKRAPSFFDEVCYTGTGSARTVAHNLGAVPELMIVKKRNTGGDDWYVYSQPTGNQYATYLNLTYQGDSGSSAWNSTSPTSSVFSLGASGGINGSGSTFVAYLFATCAGVSKVGSYTGTATTKQIDCGFTGGARFVLIKRTDSTGDWYVWDTARGIVSGNDPYLLLNTSTNEVTSTDYIDTYSAGFELSSTAPAAINASGGSFIFLAIS